MSPELVGFRELPELLAVSRSSAARYTKRPDFPAPVERLAAGPVWREAEVVAWAKAHLPLRSGRPPGSSKS
jgi:predicted DNA-binding transcriptional regulator AlpA